MRFSINQIILVLSLTVLPAVAGANDGLQAFNPPAGDVSVDFLRQVFGSVIDGLRSASGVADGQQSVVGAMMGVFNLAVLFLAMIFVGYTTIKGTVDSAHDGVLLGKKMSEIWVPIRTVGGTAFLLPLGSGFSLIQVGVLWLAVQGVGVADTAWTAAMSRFAASGTLGQVSLPDARPLAANVLRAEVCMAAMNQQFIAEDRSTRISVLPAVTQTLPNGDVATTWRWGSAEYLNPAVCGALTWQQSSQGALTEDTIRASSAPILAAHGNAVAAMIQELRPVAEQIVSWQRPTPGAVDVAAAHYVEAIAAAAKTAVDASPDVAQQSFIKHAETGGWVLAGTFFSHMTRVNDTIQSAVNMVPVSKPITIEDKEAKATLQTYQDALAFTDEYLKDRGTAPRASYDEEIQDAKSIRSADDVWRLLSLPAMTGLDAITTRIAGANTSPVTQLRAIGNDIISAGTAIKTVMFAVAGFAGSRAADWTVGNVFNTSEALKTIQGTVEWASSSLWALGAVLAYYLPAIPAIWWLMGVVRWMAGVAEAVLAAPLMAAMHVHPGGDDLVGRAGPGYLLILAMTIQPVLLLIGLILAAAITYPVGALVNMGFLAMVSGITGSSSVGIVSLVAWVALYVVMMIVAMHACFAVISAVPDNVMRFVGSQAGAQGIGVQGEKGMGGLEGGTKGAGAAAARPKPEKRPETKNQDDVEGGGKSGKDRENSIHLG